MEGSQRCAGRAVWNAQGRLTGQCRQDLCGVRGGPSEICKWGGLLRCAAGPHGVCGRTHFW